MLSVAQFVNLDGFNSALRSEHRMVLIDLGAFANRSLAEGAGFLVIVRRRFALRHGITPFLCSFTTGLSRSDGCVSEVCTDLLAAFFFLSLVFGVGVVGYKGVRIVNRQAITTELRLRLDRTPFGSGGSRFLLNSEMGQIFKLTKLARGIGFSQSRSGFNRTWRDQTCCVQERPESRRQSNNPPVTRDSP